MNRFNCIGCGESMKAELHDSGKVAECPKCKCVFTIPMPFTRAFRTAIEDLLPPEPPGSGDEKK